MRTTGRTTVAVVLGVLGFVVSAPGLGAQEAAAREEEAVLQVVDDLFDAMRAKDEDALRAVWHPEARLQSAGRDAEGRPRVSETPVDGFIAGVVGSAAYLDEVTFDEVVRIDGDLATAWVPYNLFVDDAFQHCGVDAVQLVRTDGGWVILQLTDTRRRDGCDPDRRSR